MTSRLVIVVLLLLLETWTFVTPWPWWVDFLHMFGVLVIVIVSVPKDRR